VIDLGNIADYVRLLAVAAVFGAVGGLAFELLQHRVGLAVGASDSSASKSGSDPSSDSGEIALPHMVGPYLSLGVIASLLIGAIAALGALYFFPPAISITVQAADGTSRTGLSYELVKLVGLSLLIGSAGPSVLSTMQGRVLDAVKTQKLATKVNVATRQLDVLKDASVRELDSALKKANTQHRARLTRDAVGVGRGLRSMAEPSASQGIEDSLALISLSAQREFETAMAARVAEAKETIKTA